MKAVTGAEMREIDRIAINERGIPGKVLMAFAGKSVADHVLRKYPCAKSAAVFCGTGNNGGDGFVAAYWLARSGIDVRVFIVGDSARLTPDAAVYLGVCRTSGVPVEQAGEGAALPDLMKWGVIIDSMIGTGFSGTPRGAAAALIGAINAQRPLTGRPPVVAVDIPSGLPSEGPIETGTALIADTTITMGLPKLSLVTYPGRKFVGELEIADIGFPNDLVESDAILTSMADKSLARTVLGPDKDPDTYKYAEGSLLLAGGFDGMEGAIIMCARAALECGIGLVSLLTTERARSIIAGKIPEMITATIPAGDEALILETIGALPGRRYDVLVIGPGMGRSAYSRVVFKSLVEKAGALGIKRILVDGDGLSHLSALHAQGLNPALPEAVLTPHFSEASVMTGASVDEIRKDRLAAAKKCSQTYGAVTVLKGPATIITDGSKSCINTTGGPALATAGSGDVLSGIIGSLLLRGAPSLEAAACGAYLHGLAGDIAVSRQSAEILKSTDIIGALREAIASIY